MQALETIDIRGGERGRIILAQGDLTRVPKADPADVLIVSAFPGDYTPTPNSLIGALDRSGLSVKKLAKRKAVDLRADYSCWLSRRLRNQEAGLRYDRILCFEPRVRGKPPEVVGDIFRALAPILAVRRKIRSIAMPVVAAGDQGYPVAEMLEPLLDAAIHWLDNGLPLQRLTIVTRGERSTEEARRVFLARKTAYEEAEPAPVPDAFEYDVFISYSHENLRESQTLEKALRRARPGIRIFLDRHEIDVGASWQIKIFESLERSRKVAALLSPAYLASTVCKEEFGIAWIASRQRRQPTMFPLYLYTTGLPAFMTLHNYIDCREGEGTKIAAAAKRLIAQLDEGT